MVLSLSFSSSSLASTRPTFQSILSHMASAARVMTTHRICRLPVVDPEGKLVGIVARRDLLSVFLRPDEEIAADATELLDDVMHADPATVRAAVRNNVETMTDARITTSAPEEEELIQVAMRLLWDVDGVVDVTSRVNRPVGPQSATVTTASRKDSPK